MGTAVPRPVNSSSDGNRRTVIIIGIAVAALVVIIGALLVTRDSGGKGQAEVFLEPTSSTGSNPFTDTVAAPLPSSTVPRTTSTRPRSTTTRPSNSLISTRGSTPGLYGGTQDNSSCDVNQLVAFLKANPAKAQAWAAVFGGRSADIPAYVSTLTPLLLDRDTRVTNHGYRNGSATAFQAVLQAGTAVLVDQFGIPRVKCNCGNPLTEPVALSSAPTYMGPAWPGFTPTNVIVVKQETKVNIFVINDVETGGTFTRPPGTDGSQDETIAADELCNLYPEHPACEGVEPTTTSTTEPTLGTGDVQVTLRWSSTADLDLAVTDPLGGQTSFNTPTSASGGTLDVDSNGGCDNPTTSPVENIFWPQGQSPDGDYTIYVTYFGACAGGDGPQAFALDVKLGGTSVSVVEASTAGSMHALEIPKVMATSGTIDPGQTKSYKVTKTPGGTPSTATPSTATPSTASPDSITTTTLSCAEQFPDDYMQRTLCEHNPS